MATICTRDYVKKDERGRGAPGLKETNTPRTCAVLEKQHACLSIFSAPISMMQANPNTYICTRNHPVRYSFQQSPHAGENQNHKSHNKSNAHPRHLGSDYTRNSIFLTHTWQYPQANINDCADKFSKTNCAYKYMVIISVKLLALPPPTARGERIFEPFTMKWSTFFT